MIKDECAVFGIYAPNEEPARLTFFGLQVLQHRGQESSGIATLNKHGIKCHKKLGLVSHVYEEKNITMLDKHALAAIGHNRYSTTGGNNIQNAQPFIKMNASGEEIAVAHNGNIINAHILKKELVEHDFHFDGTSDTEIIANLILYYLHLPIEEIITTLYEKLEGAYSLVILMKQSLVAIRDPLGIRPLALGKLNGFNIIASESCAFTPFGGEYVRDVKNGEAIIINTNGIKSVFNKNKYKCKLCIFEHFYIARPDSLLNGDRVHKIRYKFGKQLAIEHPCPNADMVIPVPDTSIPCAMGYAKQSGITYADCIIKNRYIHRTFIQPEQHMREMGALIKYAPLSDRVVGRKVVLVDDSIVRGTTISKLVKMIFDAGALEVHLRIPSPPIKHPCFFGVDMGTYEELIASNMSVEEICKEVGANSLGYLSLEAIKKIKNFDSTPFCKACFNGKYPLKIPQDIKITKHILES